MPKEFLNSIIVPDAVYGAGWNGSREVPTKNAVFDKIETLPGSGTKVSAFAPASPILDAFEFPVNDAGVSKKITAGGLKAYLSSMSVKLAADAVNSNASADVLADVTGLSFNVVAAVTYKFKFFIVYSAAATTTGSRWTINAPAVTNLAYRSEYSLTLSSRTFNEGLRAIGAPVASNLTSADIAGNIAVIEGVITPSAAGVVIARFASEIASSAITAKAGMSFVEYEII